MKTYADWKQKLDAVEGYMASQSQRELMFNIGKMIRVGIELGSYKGLSACLVAAGMASSSGKAKRLFCVDTFNMTGFESFKTEDEMHETLTEFKRHTKSCGVDNLCHPCVMSTDESPGEFIKIGLENVDYLFVDADHHKQPTKDNCLKHLPLLRSGAIILFHDYDPQGFQEVKDAVDELVEEGAIVRDSVIDDCWIGHKP